MKSSPIFKFNVKECFGLKIANLQKMSMMKK